MKVLTRAIVSNSDMMKNYKTCREKAETYGKIFVLKNNQPDAVLFSIAEYERVSEIIEYLESLEDNDIQKFIKSLPKEGLRKTYSLSKMKEDSKIPDANDVADRTYVTDVLNSTDAPNEPNMLSAQQ